jgi:aryl-alcohol dehydrogenase
VKIKAAVARTHGAPLVIEGLVLDDPRDDEIVVRLVASGVAGVDREATLGILPMPLPFVPGTEGAGIVEHVGAAVTGLVAGDAVVIGYGFCGACANCAGSNPRACLEFAALNLGGRRIDGSAPFVSDEETGGPVNGFFFGQSSFATHLVCRASSAIKVPMGAPLEILACLGGELVVGASAIMRSLDLRDDSSLIIAGANAVGLIACMVAKARGATTIIVADGDETRLAIASDCGATTVVAFDDLAVTAKRLVADGVMFALDTTGETTVAAACLDGLAPTGLCVLLPPQTRIPDDSGPTDDRRIVTEAALIAPDAMIEELAALHGEGKLPIDRLISFFPFELVNDALEALVAGTVLKPVLRFPLGSFGDLDRALTEGAAKDVPDPVVEIEDKERQPVAAIAP